MNLSDLLTALLPLGVLIFWIVGLLKDVTNANLNGVVTRVIAAAAAFGAVALYAHSSIDLGGGSRAAVATLSWVDQVLVALLIAATGGTGSDALRTFNRADTNVQSKLLPDKHT